MGHKVDVFKPAKEMRVRLSDSGNRLVLDFAMPVRNAEVYLGKRKLGDLGAGRHFDVTRYVAESKGRSLWIAGMDEAGKVYGQSLQTMRTFRVLKTPFHKEWSRNTRKADRLRSEQELLGRTVLPLVTGSYCGGAPQSDEFRLTILKVDGDGRNKEVGDAIEISVDFSTIPLGVTVRDDILYLSVSNSGGDVLHGNIHYFEGSGPSGFELDLAGATASTAGEYRVTALVMTDLLGGGEFTWYPTNQILLYFGVEAPFVIPGSYYVEPIEPPDPPEDVDIPNDGLDRFRAYTDKHVVDLDEEFTITWEEERNVRTYSVAPTMATNPPDGLVNNTQSMMADEDRRLSTTASGAFSVQTDIYDEETGEYRHTTVRDLGPEFFSDKWVVLHYHVYANRNDGIVRRSNTLVVYVRRPGSTKPSPPILGVERCGDWLTDRDCGAGVYLCWRHGPEEEEGHFIVEKALYEAGGTSRWEHYRLGIPPDQRNLFVPISDFFSKAGSTQFRMLFSRESPPGEIEIDDIEEIRGVFGGLYSLADENPSYSQYSNVVSITALAPPVLLRVFEDDRLCPGTISFTWTPVERADDYEHEVSDDPSFRNRDRVVRDLQSAHAEDYSALYDSLEEYEEAVRLFGPSETQSGLFLNSLPGAVLADAEVLFVRVRSRSGGPPCFLWSSWSNILLIER